MPGIESMLLSLIIMHTKKKNSYKTIAAQFTMKYSKYSFIAFKKFPITFCLVTKCVLINRIPIFFFFQIAFRCIFYLFQDSMTVDTIITRFSGNQNISTEWGGHLFNILPGGTRTILTPYNGRTNSQRTCQ